MLISDYACRCPVDQSRDTKNTEGWGAATAVFTEARASERFSTTIERCIIARMEQLPTPHNNFFHFALSHLPNARGLIETQLSPQALATLKLETLRLCTGSFVDADLREKFSDLLFSVELADPAGSDRHDEALVYFLFEHKSQSDPLTVLQLLSYIVRIWEQRIRDGLPVCAVIPLLVYHGESGWRAAKSLSELVDCTIGAGGLSSALSPATAGP